MNAEEVRQHIRAWVENTLSVPSPLFNNLPPCPYSREALLKNRVDIQCVDGAELIESANQVARTWADKYEIVLLAAEAHTITPEELMHGIADYNDRFEASDMVAFFDHPDCKDPKYKVRSGNGKYVLVGTQRRKNFIEAAQPLYKKQYFAQVTKQFLSEERLTAHSHAKC